MRRRWRMRAGWLLVAGLAAAIGVSYVRTWSLSIERGETGLFCVKFSQGNLRVLSASADSSVPDGSERPVDRLWKRWQRIPAIAWEFTDVEGTLPPDDFPFRERSFSCTIWPLLGLAAFALGLGALYPLYQPRLKLAQLQLKFAARETMSASRPTVAPRVGYWVEWAIVAATCAVTVSSLAVWLASYAGLPGCSDYIILARTGPLEGDTCRVERCPAVYWPFSLVVELRRGILSVLYPTCVPPTKAPPRQMVRRGRFAWTVATDWPVQCVREPDEYEYSSNGYWPSQSFVAARPGQCLDDASLFKAVHVVEVPCWFPVMLGAGWPVVAFFRGPWRRAGRRVRGLCAACGYDLRGSVSAVCPECGTAVPRGAERRSAGEGSSALRAEKTVIGIGASTRD